jgi:hypothetical protein
MIGIILLLLSLLFGLVLSGSSHTPSTEVDDDNSGAVMPSPNNILLKTSYLIQ